MTVKKPIIYDELVDVRFSDLDFYNHVNSKHYIDMVSTARLNFMERQMKTPISDVTQKGFGFYMTKSVVHYKKPINGLQRVRALSHVAEVTDGRLLAIPFELKSEDGSRLFADGILEFMIVDIKNGRPTPGPEWLMALFLD